MTMEAGQVFIIGNKRSGTSLLTSLLNLHPNIFVSYESDIIWILFQAEKQGLSHLRPYPWDGPLGMRATLKACQGMLQDFSNRAPRGKNPVEIFSSVLEYLMVHGSDVQRPYPKKDLSWLGDKKPVQQCDPEISPFLRRHFPGARYIHMVRNPRAVVPSKIRAAEKWNEGVPEYWKGTPAQILERWAVHEEWVLEAKSWGGGRVHSLRMEDLCEEPVRRMREVFEHLEVDVPENMDDTIRASVRRDPNEKYRSFSLPALPAAERIMRLYHYTP
jgi:hypothetical protein